MSVNLAAVRERLTGAVSDAFLLAEQRKGRDPLEMSLSKLGGCTREAAYRLSATPPDQEWDGGGEKRPAAQGTWQHRGLLPNLRLALRGARTEVPVQLAASGLTLPGTTDLWWRRRPVHGGHGVIDVKTLREWGLGWVRENGGRPRDKVQTDGYALALRQSEGADIRWTALVYLDRASGESEVIVRDFGPANAAAVMGRMDELSSWAKQPQMAPRDERGPGLSIVCDGCPWLRKCWGETATPGVPGGQRVLIEEGTYSVEQALEMYDAARALAKEGDDDKAFARAMLVGIDSGTYGRYALSWGKGSPGGGVNKAKAWDALIAAGADLEQYAKELLVELPLTSGRAGAISVGVADE